MTAGFVEKENCCERAFIGCGECYHLWTSENFEIIFTDEDDYKIGMNIIGIASKLFPEVRLLTFEIMSNHLHLTCSGSLDKILALFETIKDLLKRFAKVKGRIINWDGFVAGTRLLETLSDIRNVIVYDNRNGYVVSNQYTPFTYPWGANRYYFNPDACRLAEIGARPMHIREIRAISHVRYADSVKGLMKFDGYALPLSFCDIEIGEQLFRDAPHYFNKIAKNIESSAAIAKEIGESIHYTDDELFDAVSKICSRKYADPVPSRLKPEAKIEVAKTMRFEYNASVKQIQRMLKLDSGIISALFQNNNR